MAIYGVEDTFVIGEYRFQIGFDSSNDCALDQRDVGVGHRQSIDEVALSALPGPQLLEAYHGADRDTRYEAFTLDITTVREEYKTARRAHRANSS